MDWSSNQLNKFIVQIAANVHKIGQFDGAVYGLAACHWRILKKDCRYADWRPNLYHQIKWVSSLVAVPSDLPLPPAMTSMNRSFTSVQMFHTHTPPSGDKSWGPDCEVKMRMKREMKMRWKWRWNESYLTGARDGERKKGEEEPRENTNTNTPCPERANPERQGKRKSGGRRKNTKTSGGGEGRTRLNQPNPSENKTYLSTHGTKPTWRGEHAWNRGPMGT